MIVIDVSRLDKLIEENTRLGMVLTNPKSVLIPLLSVK